MPQEEAPRKLAFVLSGGGSLGSLQVGILDALFEHGVRPDLIVGTSIGALNGAWLARNPSLEGVRELERVWLSIKRDDIFGSGSLRVALRIVLGRDHVYDNRGLVGLLTRHFGGMSFEDLAVPLSVTATDLDTGELEAFDRGPLLPALLASSALPGVFPPVQIGGHRYADGGILSHCSLETAWRAGATHLVAIECPHRPPRDAYGIMGPISRALAAAVGRQCRTELERFRAFCPTLLLWPDITVDAEPADEYAKVPEWIEWAKGWARDFLKGQGEAFLATLHGGEMASQDAAA